VDKKEIDAKIETLGKINMRKLNAVENIVENEAFAFYEQMLHFL